jgi:hypothetical protein
MLLVVLKDWVIETNETECWSNNSTSLARRPAAPAGQDGPERPLDVSPRQSIDGNRSDPPKSGDLNAENILACAERPRGQHSITFCLSPGHEPILRVRAPFALNTAPRRNLAQILRGRIDLSIVLPTHRG